MSTDRSDTVPWPETVARDAVADLPPVRDDEPKSLRQDILDELSDHLSCAFRRELLRTDGDAARAVANVRDRFGDPARVARRLWLDAMKGKLMAQRIVIATCGFLVTACVLFGALLWRIAADTRAANAALLEQSRETNAALLERFADLAQQPPAIDPQWNPASARFVVGSEDGPPAEDMQVTFQPVSHSISDPPQGLRLHETVGPDGRVDFGLLQPGRYSLDVDTPWHESHRRVVQVLAGRALDLTIVCPAEPPASVPLSWNVEWPSNVAGLPDDQDIWFVVQISGSASRKIAGELWTPPRHGRVLAFRRDGRMIDLTDPEVMRSLPDDPLPGVRDYQLDNLRMAYAPGPAEPGHVWADGYYSVQEQSLAVWDGTGSPLQLLAAEAAIKIDSDGSGVSETTGTLKAQVLQMSRPRQHFTAPADGTAEWTLKVPPGLVAVAALQLELEANGASGERSLSDRVKAFLEAERNAEAAAPAESET